MSYGRDYLNHFREFGIAAMNPILFGLYRNSDARTKYMIDDVLTSVPVMGDIYESVFKMRQMDDYMDNNPNVDWSDALRYHRFGSTTAGVIASSGYSFVSKNIDKLYNDEKSEKFNSRVQREVKARLRQYYGIW